MKNIELVTQEDFTPVIEKLDFLAQSFESLMREKHWKVYSNEEAASLLRVSKRTLQNWRDKGLISYHQIGSKIYYSREAMETFLENHKVKRFN